MPQRETCTKCSNSFNPTVYTAEERLLQALFGTRLCPKCKAEIGTAKCTKCMETAVSPVYYNNEPFHPECLAKEMNV